MKSWFFFKKCSLSRVTSRASRFLFHLLFPVECSWRENSKDCVQRFRWKISRLHTRPIFRSLAPFRFMSRWRHGENKPTVEGMQFLASASCSIRKRFSETLHNVDASGTRRNVFPGAWKLSIFSCSSAKHSCEWKTFSVANNHSFHSALGIFASCSSQARKFFRLNNFPLVWRFLVCHEAISRFPYRRELN